MRAIFRRLGPLLVIGVVVMGLLIAAWGRAVSHAGAANAAAPAWATPGAITLRKVSALSSAETEPNFLSNLDCTLTTYHMVADATMRSGCFTPTAFGLVDSDSDTVIFNGTDEGLPLLPYSNGEVLVPWPKALDMVALDAAATGGSYLSLYTNPLAHLREQRNVLGQLTSKQLTAPPELPVTDAQGKHLLVNAQTLAFADSGSWLVAETMSGSFVRINLATLSTKAFAPAFAAAGLPGTLKSQVAVSGDGQYAAINNEAAGSFKVYDLPNCSAAQAGNCPAYDYRPFIRSKVPGLTSIRHVRMVNEGLLSFEATSSTSSESGTYLMARAASITSLADYIGLGDSYTSGEGAFDYRSGTDTSDNHCHVSAVSYPLLLTKDVFSADGGHSVACSGAAINDVASTSVNYHGQVEHSDSYQQLQQDQPALLASVLLNYLPGYVAQQRFVQTYQPRVVTVSVGGDDVGFGDILETCVLPHISLHLSDNTCFNTYEDRLELKKLVDRTGQRWQALFRQLKSESPLSVVYAVGYPDIVSDTGNCALNVHLNQSEREFAREMVMYINQVMAQAAAKTGVQYVDITGALAGHRLCESNQAAVAVNGLTAGTAAGVLGLNFLGKESYHPNTLGQYLMEQAILHAANNFTATAASSVPGDSSQSFLNRPTSGRPVVVRQPANLTGTRVVAAGAAVHITADGSALGLVPGQSYSVTFSDNSAALGSLTAGADGSLSGDVTVPADTAPGGHIIDVNGSTQTGSTTDVTQPIYVGVSGDQDGDGIPDNQDSCPYARNSGQDSDRDGIDDACDGSIGAPPGTTPGGTAPVGSSGSSQESGAAPGTGGAGSNPAAVQVETAVVSGQPLETPSLEGVSLNASGAGALGQLEQGHTGNATRLLNQPAHGRLALTPAPSGHIRGTLPVWPWVWWGALIVLGWLLLLAALTAWRYMAERRRHWRPRPAVA